METIKKYNLRLVTNWNNILNLNPIIYYSMLKSMIDEKNIKQDKNLPHKH